MNKAEFYSRPYMVEAKNILHGMSSDIEHLDPGKLEHIRELGFALQKEVNEDFFNMKLSYAVSELKDATNSLRTVANNIAVLEARFTNMELHLTNIDFGLVGLSASVATLITHFGEIKDRMFI